MTYYPSHGVYHPILMREAVVFVVPWECGAKGRCPAGTRAGAVPALRNYAVVYDSNRSEIRS